MTTITHKLSLLALVLLLSPAGVALAQGGAPITIGAPAPQGDLTEVPLDGGASLLLAAGVGLGLKKLRARRRA
jgi:hypothetical protein